MKPGAISTLPRFYPVALGEPPRLPDGSVDVRALLRQWDDAINEGCSQRPNPIVSGGKP